MLMTFLAFDEYFRIDDQSYRFETENISLRLYNLYAKRLNFSNITQQIQKYGCHSNYRRVTLNLFDITSRADTISNERNELCNPVSHPTNRKRH